MRRADDLQLSEKQTQQLQQILLSHQKNMEAIREEVHPRVAAELESFRSQVEAILTEEQADQWNARFNDMAQQWMPPPPGPPGAPPFPPPGFGPPPPGPLIPSP